MNRLILLASLTLGLALSFVPIPAEAGRSAITTSGGGDALTVVVHGITDYCSTNARTAVIVRETTIRIVRDRPTSASRCLTERDLTFLIRDVPPGTYTISYEQIPLIAPARFIKVASTTVSVSD